MFIKYQYTSKAYKLAGTSYVRPLLACACAAQAAAAAAAAAATGSAAFNVRHHSVAFSSALPAAVRVSIYTFFHTNISYRWRRLPYVNVASRPNFLFCRHHGAHTLPYRIMLAVVWDLVYGTRRCALSTVSLVKLLLLSCDNKPHFFFTVELLS